MCPGTPLLPESQKGRLLSPLADPPPGKGGSHTAILLLVRVPVCVFFRTSLGVCL